MNNLFILVSLVLVALCGCKLRKDTSESVRIDRHADGRVEGQASWMQFVDRDSTSRYWAFMSDSSFFFHPDEGLWGRSGKVVYIERNAAEIKEAKYRATYDSLGMKRSREERDTHSSWIRYLWSNWFWILAIGAGVGVWFVVGQVIKLRN